MTADSKATLLRYLQRGREALVWKVAGISEYDVRRPLTPTATNLLGLVKHVASVEAGYFGEVFGRPFPEPIPWYDEDTEANADMWATADEERDDLIAFYQRVWAHSDATIAELDLDAPGRVPWWGDRGDVTLQQILVHMIAETDRHAGHADIVRELVDGAAGYHTDVSNMPDEDAAWWAIYHEQVEAAARTAAARTDGSAPT